MDERQKQLARILELAPVIPVLTIEEADIAVPLARALVAGGLPVIEITLRTAVAIESIRAVRQAVPEAVVGAGTITEPTQIADAAAAGARFAVTPGTTASLIQAAAGAGIPVLPGAATATESMARLERGMTYQKFFPAAASGGVAALKALAAPLPRIRYVPTGGIDAAQAPAYLACPNVVAVGGSWVAPADAVRARDWSRIEALATAAAAMSR